MPIVRGHMVSAVRTVVAIVLSAALPGCGSNIAATNSVAESAANETEPTDSLEHADDARAESSTEAIAVPNPSASNPVTVVMTIQPHRAAFGETVEVIVNIHIAKAHFVHAADDAEGPFVPVSVSLTLPEGIEPLGEWQLPAPEKGHGNTRIYRNATVLRRSLKVVSNSLPETVTVTGALQYQVCTDEICWPQGNLELSAPLTILSQPR